MDVAQSSLAAALAAAQALLSDPAGTQEAAAKAVSVLTPFSGVPHPHVPFLTAAALQRLGHYRDAAEHYETALRLLPELIHARTNLIQVCLALEPPQLEAAKKHAEEAVAREPQNPERLFLQALVLERAGKEEHAQRALQRCLALDPRSIKAYVNLDALYLRSGNLQASRALAGLAIREMERSGGAFAFWRHPLQRPPHVHPVRAAQNAKRRVGADACRGRRASRRGRGGMPATSRGWRCSRHT